MGVKKKPYVRYGDSYRTATVTTRARDPLSDFRANCGVQDEREALTVVESFGSGRVQTVIFAVSVQGEVLTPLVLFFP